jgi:DNA primase
MEKCSVRDAALRLREWFRGSLPEQEGKQKPAAEKQFQPDSPASAETGESTLVNQPLKFQLKNIDHTHPYLASRGISKETAEKFGVGFFSGKGSMSGRIVFPIHNESGELVAYAGRSIDGAAGERYKFPSGFHKSAVLYNLHRAIGESNPERQVVVVEGFFDCMKVTAAGFPCVALMGSSLSATQQETLGQHFQRVVLLFDGDDAGKKATDECLLRFGPQLWVRALVLPSGQQPDQLSTEELSQLLGSL